MSLKADIIDLGDTVKSLHDVSSLKSFWHFKLWIMPFYQLSKVSKLVDNKIDLILQCNPNINGSKWDLKMNNGHYSTNTSIIFLQWPL